MNKPIAQRNPPARDRRVHIESLLRRYPDVTPAEDAEILRFLKKGPAAEAWLVTSHADLQPHLRRFHADHSDHFSLGTKEYLVVAALVLIIVLACTLLGDAGLR
ncbi:hypothetical protein E2493_02270 [Sphingomonas parva]|uniref:Uncharacterized protein n=1 Tax=Sphingomonas parva TaxID=2555898 RepID=A0A4Y8ZXE5_9SPHN|nr:hypothetical protein [Sphingomonas parva]TFI60092.1 hypothetical protein E2493_02270 [Sphingomonas parva]